MKIKRVYLPYDKHDGLRILVDRLWPRGMSKQTAHVDLWFKEIAPSNELRKWLHENPPERWLEFKKRYKAELAAKPEVLREFKEQLKGHQNVAFLFGAKDVEHNQAVALRDFLAG